MLTYSVLYLGSYVTLYLRLPILNDPLYDGDRVAQFIRHLILIFMSYQLSNFLWRRKYVSNIQIPKAKVEPDNNAVLITGCDSGFGNLLARKLDRAGFKVYAACLDPDCDGSRQLAQDSSDKLQTLRLDVTSDSQVDEAYEFVKKDLDKFKYTKCPSATKNPDLLAVVNNAGILATGEVEFGKDLRPFESQLAVNCLGTIRVTKAFSPLLRRCKSYPRLVNVTSLAARISLPGMIGYCVSKCAALSFTDGVRTELRKWNVQVVSIEPHLFRTNLIAMEAQHQALARLWANSRPETREDYGEQFFKGAAKLLDHGIGTARSNIPDVVDALFESVTNRWPELHRKVCSSELERLRCWFLINILPSSVQNYLLSKGASYITGEPAMLAQVDKLKN